MGTKVADSLAILGMLAVVGCARSNPVGGPDPDPDPDPNPFVGMAFAA